MVNMQIVRSFRLYATFGLPVLMVVLLFFALSVTSPLSAGPAGILLVFALMYLVALSLLFAALALVLVVVEKVANRTQTIGKKLYYIAAIVAMAPIFILALNTIGQLDIKDFILVLILELMACFYVARRMK
ncbi:MAG: hypothetical protein PVI21_04515 [Candidatus Woesebacteria bacterium]